MLKNAGIYRSSTNKWVFGVCSGLADRFGVNPMWVRIGMLLAALLPAGLGTIPVGLAYVAAAVLLPERETPPFVE